MGAPLAGRAILPAVWRPRGPGAGVCLLESATGLSRFLALLATLVVLILLHMAYNVVMVLPDFTPIKANPVLRLALTIVKNIARGIAFLLALGCLFALRNELAARWQPLFGS